MAATPESWSPQEDADATRMLLLTYEFFELETAASEHTEAAASIRKRIDDSRTKYPPHPDPISMLLHVQPRRLLSAMYHEVQAEKLSHMSETLALEHDVIEMQNANHIADD